MNDRGLTTRKGFVQRGALGAAGIFAGGSLLAACGGSSSSSSSSSSSTAPAKIGNVTGIVWKGYDDPKAFATLTSQDGLNMQMQYISASNNEIVTKLRGGAKGSIDIVTPGKVFMGPMIEAGLLEPLDLSKVPNTKQLYPMFQAPDWAMSGGKTYGVPIAWYDFPMNAIPSIVPEQPSTYSELANSKYKGKLTTVDDPQNLYLLLKEILHTSDFSKLTKDQLQQAVDMFNTIKPNIVTIAPSFGDVIDIMNRGDAGLCILGYGYVQFTLESKGVKCTTFAPAEVGALTSADLYCIAADAPNSDGAHAVLNQSISAQGNVYMNAFQYTGVVNPGSVPLMPANQKNLYPYNDLAAYLEKNSFFDVPPAETTGDAASQEDVTNAWTQIKTS